MYAGIEMKLQKALKTDKHKYNVLVNESFFVHAFYNIVFIFG